MGKIAEKKAAKKRSTRGKKVKLVGCFVVFCFFFAVLFLCGFYTLLVCFLAVMSTRKIIFPRRKNFFFSL